MMTKQQRDTVELAKPPPGTGSRKIGFSENPILGVAAKLECRRILERTARGRANAKAKGVKFGRKPTPTPHQQNEARKRLEAGETQRSVARSYNVSQSTISRLTA
ncbi:MAG TPA: recombinase family protein [Xanthobacteraceae bacterium]